MMTNEEYMKEYMSVLKGAHIVEATVLDEEFTDEVIPVLLVKTPEGKFYQVDVLMDPEGNGPGHLDINLREGL